MKKTAVAIAIAAITASAAQASVSVNVNVGVPATRVVVSAPPSVRFEVAPLFIASPTLGFYVGVDTPYDIIFSSDYYYLYYSNSWHRSNSYNGPWIEVPYRSLPHGIRNHRIEQIRSYRDREYRSYRRDREHFRGKYFRPDHERREEKRDRKDERREEKQDRKQHGRDRN